MKRCNKRGEVARQDGETPTARIHLDHETLVNAASQSKPSTIEGLLQDVWSLLRLHDRGPVACPVPPARAPALQQSCGIAAHPDTLSPRVRGWLASAGSLFTGQARTGTPIHPASTALCLLPQRLLCGKARRRAAAHPDIDALNVCRRPAAAGHSVLVGRRPCLRRERAGGHAGRALGAPDRGPPVLECGMCGRPLRRSRVADLGCRRSNIISRRADWRRTTVQKLVVPLQERPVCHPELLPHNKMSDMQTLQYARGPTTRIKSEASTATWHRQADIAASAPEAHQRSRCAHVCGARAALVSSPRCAAAAHAASLPRRTCSGCHGGAAKRASGVCNQRTWCRTCRHARSTDMH